jgi:hypothetical protein
MKPCARLDVLVGSRVDQTHAAAAHQGEAARAWIFTVSRGGLLDIEKLQFNDGNHFATVTAAFDPAKLAFH